MSAGMVFRNYYKTMIWIAAMFYMLFTPGNLVPKNGIFEIPHFDKLVHFGMFALLIFLFRIDSEKQVQNRHSLLIKFTISAVLFAGLSEVIQYNFIEGRAGSIYDFFADMCGFTIGSLFYLWPWGRISSKTKAMH